MCHGSANLFCKGLGSKYFRLYGSYGLCCNYSTMPYMHRQYVNEEEWLCSEKILLTKTGGGPAQRCSLLTPGIYQQNYP